MKIKLIGDVQIVQDNKNSKHNYFAWPTVTRLNNGKLAVVSSGFRTAHVDPFGKTVISYSEDEGKTFTRPAPVIDTPLDDRDGGICTFGKHGVIVTSFNNNIKTQQSVLPYHHEFLTYKSAYLDNITEKDLENYLGATFCISLDDGVTFSEIYKSPITSPHGPIELQDGTILWVGTDFSKSGRIYAYTVHLDGTMEFVGEIKSDGIEGEVNGVRLKESFERSACEPYAFQLPDGKIICQIRIDLFTLLQAESADGGKTWTAPHRVAECFVAPAHIMTHSSGLLISCGGYRSNPYDVRMMLSKDGGKTWDIDHILFKGHNWDIGYPSTVELKDGSLLTVFYAHYPTESDPSLILAQRWTFEE